VTGFTSDQVMQLLKLFRRLPLLCMIAMPACPLFAERALTVLVLDQSKRAISGVVVQLKIGTNIVSSVITGEDGHAEFRQLTSDRYELTAAKEGFEPIHDDGVNV